MINKNPNKKMGEKLNFIMKDLELLNYLGLC